VIAFIVRNWFRDALETLFVVAIGGMVASVVRQARDGTLPIYRCRACGRVTSRAYEGCRHCGAPVA
jgi:uncharacterized OB-fold protein